MTKLRYLILLFLISNVFSSECYDKGNPSGSKDCKDLAVAEGKEYCCYLKAKSGIIGCFELTKAQYDNIEDTISELEKEAGNGEKVEKLDCKNDYIKFYLFSLLLLILL